MLRVRRLITYKRLLKFSNSGTGNGTKLLHDRLLGSRDGSPTESIPKYNSLPLWLSHSLLKLRNLLIYFEHVLGLHQLMVLTLDRIIFCLSQQWNSGPLVTVPKFARNIPTQNSWMFANVCIVRTSIRMYLCCNRHMNESNVREIYVRRSVTYYVMSSLYPITYFIMVYCFPTWAQMTRCFELSKTPWWNTHRQLRLNISQVVERTICGVRTVRLDFHGPLPNWVLCPCTKYEWAHRFIMYLSPKLCKVHQIFDHRTLFCFLSRTNSQVQRRKKKNRMPTKPEQW